MEQNKQVYVVVRKVYMVRAGYVVLSDAMSEVTGVFTDRESAIDFTKKLVTGMCIGNEPREFIFADKNELMSKRQNLEYVVHQKQRGTYPYFVYECVSESLLTADFAEN